MKRAIPLTVALIALFAACENDSSSPKDSAPKTEIRVMRDVDYVSNKYFYFDDPHSFIGPRLADSQILVFRAVLPADLIAHPEIFRVPAWMIADAVGDGQSIRDAADVLNANNTPSPSWFNDVELLTLGEDYNLITEGPTQRVVAIELVDPIPDSAQKALAVSYINMDDVAVGGSYSTLGVNHAGVDTLMLELIKAPDPTPYYPFGSTWRLALRNAYFLGWTNIQPGSLKVVIEDFLSVRADVSRPQGSSIPYFQIFGLDLVDKNGHAPPDGILGAGLVDFEHGVLWFPSLHPFAPDPDDVDQWSGGEFAFTGEYQAQYDTSKRIYEERLNGVSEQEVHQYDIRVTRTLPGE